MAADAATSGGAAPPLFPVSRLVWLGFDLIFRPGHESHYRWRL